MAPENTATLILLRHGESEWNALNLFTGWVGRRPHREGQGRGRPRGELIKERARRPTCCTPRCCAARSPPPTSRSTTPTGTGFRCIATGGSTNGTTARCRASTRPRPRPSTARSSSWPGGAATTRRHRRSSPAPSTARTAIPRYADIAGAAPLTECLADVVARFVPYYTEAIEPDLRAGKTVLIAAHGNSLARAGQVPRRHVRRRRGRAQHPDRHPAALRLGRAT